MYKHLQHIFWCWLWFFARTTFHKLELICFCVKVVTTFFFFFLLFSTAAIFCIGKGPAWHCDCWKFLLLMWPGLATQANCYSTNLVVASSLLFRDVMFQHLVCTLFLLDQHFRISRFSLVCAIFFGFLVHLWNVVVFMESVFVKPVIALFS